MGAPEIEDRSEVESDRALKLVTTIASIAFISGAFVVSCLRLFSGHELEFMGGAMLDLAERARDGRPLYAPPTLEPMPFVYTPGWYILVGALGKAIPLRSAARLVGAAANLSSGVLIAALARRRGAASERVLACIAIYAAGYALTGCWQDLERVDALATAFVVAGAWAWTCPRAGASALAGLLLGAALSCKQTMTPIAFAMVTADLVARRWRRAALFALAVSTCPGALWLAATTESRAWFDFYALELPRQHGILWTRAPLVVSDLARSFLLLTGSVVAVGRRLRGANGRSAPSLAAPLLGAFASAVLSRLHEGGWSNVLMPWAALAAAAVAELPTSGSTVTWLRYALIGQLALFGQSLVDAVPTSEQRRGAECLGAVVRGLETRGEVWVTGRGQVTATRHAHIAAVMDVLRAGYPLPKDIEDALTKQRLAAILIDDGGELLADRSDRLLRAVVQNYEVAGRVDGGPALPSGFDTRPTWVLVPRGKRLEGGALLARLRSEQRSVSARPWLCDAEVRFVHVDTEDLSRLTLPKRPR